MSSPTNLTDSLSKLRDKDSGFPNPDRPRATTAVVHERKFATDYFMIIAYALFAAALCIQLGLIVWLDLI